jgi:hypothetical protein
VQGGSNVCALFLQLRRPALRCKPADLSPRCKPPHLAAVWLCVALCSVLVGTMQQFPICISDIDNEGNLRAQLIHTFNNRLSMSFNGQVPCPPSGANITFTSRGMAGASCYHWISVCEL